MAEDVRTSECIVIGAGPAGLTAALYLARFRRDVLVLHDGKSRAMRIPKTHNAPGFPEGVSGNELISRMAEHAREFGAVIEVAEIVRARRGQGGGFTLESRDGRVFTARVLVLATGLFLNQVELDDETHEQAIGDGVLRYCPVCDAYEHTDKRIGVIGCNVNGAAEALFLRQYSRELALMPRDHAELTDAQRAQLHAAGIEVIEAPVERYVPRRDHIEVFLRGVDTSLRFDVVYPALGCRQRTELAVQLGLAVDETGSTDVRSPFGTDVPGLYCAGDIVDGLDQISVAMGHGAIAATRAHNWLRAQDVHTLQDRSAAGEFRGG